MSLTPLIDREGHVRAWADRKIGWISEPKGNVVALIAFDGVFKAQANAEQIGWVEDDHIRNRYGQVVLVQPTAKIDGLVMPRPRKIPKPPQLRLPVGRPMLKWLQWPMKPQPAWADYNHSSTMA